MVPLLHMLEIPPAWTSLCSHSYKPTGVSFIRTCSTLLVEGSPLLKVNLESKNL